MVWAEGDLGVSRSKCFIKDVLPINSWVRGVKEKRWNRYIEEKIKLRRWIKKEEVYSITNSGTLCGRII